MGISKIHIVLFLVTLVTTFLAGFFQGGSVAGGISFSAALLFILGAHEMGHFIFGKRYGVDISPPYFIPAPPLISPIGTFGAFIKIRSSISTKKALFDIGLAGPVAGIIAAIPVIIVGLRLSRVIEAGNNEIKDGISLGSPLIFTFLSEVLLGNIGEGYDILLHPVAFAGWIGLFVTALNLIPAGQLDGGHIMYSLLSRKWYRLSSISMVLILAILGIGTRPLIQFLNSFFEGSGFSYIREVFVFDGWPGWIMWAAILSIMGTRHPPTMYDEVPLDGKRKMLGVFALLLFIGCFTPVPIKI
ncbi:MAG TPA: site-2 protease family protein [Thermodesulfobacteriota bacterium]|nr:site-2 protease family protein [Thermodesulfobacteriota bacterium]